jgi:hypothetical protein
MGAPRRLTARQRISAMRLRLGERGPKMIRSNLMLNVVFCPMGSDDLLDNVDISRGAF